MINTTARSIRWLVISGLVTLTIAGLIVLLHAGAAVAHPTDSNGVVSGRVVDAIGPVAGANVRMRATDRVTTSGPTGAFTLTGLPEGQTIEMTAWADGYYVASEHVTPTASSLVLSLRAYHTEDHPDYTWVSPISGTSGLACGNCHPMVVDQWAGNAHGTAIENARFFSLYNGTDISSTEPVGPGFVQDFPQMAGPCANCHAPGAGVDGYLSTNMNDVRDQVTAGIHCDYCHKIGGVYLNPATGSVYANVPGAQSQRVLRPPVGDQIFFGPFDDIHDPDTYLPLISESAFCAPCHQFSFWGTPIYASFDEWLASPYALQGITCQDCHMPPNGDTHFALPEVGGLDHPPEHIPSHLQLGAKDPDFLRQTVSMTLQVQQAPGRLSLSVAITNTGAGHHVPTDFPGRHLILIIEANDDQGRPLQQLAGPVVPDWGGPQAGQSGEAYARVLQDVASGQYPVVSYWKQARVHSDNRIAALEAAVSDYRFAYPSGDGSVRVAAQLIFRRVFADLAEQKQWDMPDFIMAEQMLTLPPSPYQQAFLPLVSAGGR